MIVDKPISFICSNLFPHIIIYLSEIFVRLKHEIFLYRWKDSFILILIYKIYLPTVEYKKHNSIPKFRKIKMLSSCEI